MIADIAVFQAMSSNYRVKGKQFILRALKLDSEEKVQINVLLQHD